MEAILTIPIEYVGTEPQEDGEYAGFDANVVSVARPTVLLLLDRHPVVPSTGEVAVPVVA